MPAETEPAPALKEIFSAARIREIAVQLHAVYPALDEKQFVRQGLEGLDGLALMERLRRVTSCLHATLPPSYPAALELLYQLAPRLGHSFVALTLPDFVAQYGRGDFARSMEALKFFTPFGSSEFGIRHFIRDDATRALRIIQQWADDPNEHVRRLASEGPRPRLPWSFRLEAIQADPELTAPILEKLRADPSLYVRKSVANHLNDHAKQHPEWVVARLSRWPREEPTTGWITRHALRTLIKQGHPQALALIGAGEPAQVETLSFSIEPKQVRLGESIVIAAALRSTAAEQQRVVADYAVHYARASGRAARKVFKWKELDLPPGKTVQLSKRQLFKNFTTRTHFAGRHRVELQLNGQTVAESAFELTV